MSENKRKTNIPPNMKVPQYPHTAWLALTGKCNMKCNHCPVIRKAETNEDISDATYNKFCEEILPNLREMILGANNYGEQTLSARIYDILDKSYSHGVKVTIWTNGALLNEKLIDKIIRTNTDVTISMEGVGERYQDVRHIPYYVIERNIKCLIDSKQKTNTQTRVEVAYTIFKNNLNDIYELLNLGLDAIGINYLVPMNAEWEKVSFSRDDIAELENTFFNDLRAKTKDKNVRLSIKKLPNKNSPAISLMCNKPWSAVSIRENGDVLPCCIAGDDMILGNINKKPFLDIWHGRKYSNLRQSFIDQKLFGTCRHCKGLHTDKEYSVSDTIKKTIKTTLVNLKMYKVLNMVVEVNRNFRRRI